ncbi:MAG: PadR family transcriptional regulator [Caldilineaceae bacterium]|nr:PadR family transcriptional regulator [Caldilineaceae bacterium]
MSLKHTLLALLSAETGHGYELKKRFEEALGPLWPLREAQIYNNLRILEKEGLVSLAAVVAQEGGPDRKEYAVTAEGGRVLADWLATPVVENQKLKDDFYLKLSVLARVLQDGPRLADLLWQQRTHYLQRLRELEDTLREAEAQEDSVTAALLEGAILHTEADLAWLDRCESRLLPERTGP